MSQWHCGFGLSEKVNSLVWCHGVEGDNVESSCQSYYVDNPSMREKKRTRYGWLSGSRPREERMEWSQPTQVEGSRWRGKWCRRWEGEGRVDVGSAVMLVAAPQGVGMTRTLSSSPPLSPQPAKTSNGLMNNWQVQQKANEQFSTIRWWRYKGDTRAAAPAITNDSFACWEILALKA